MESDTTIISVIGTFATFIICLFSFKAERETCQALRSLAEAKSTLLPGPPNSTHDGRLVCVSGTVVTEQEALLDPQFAVSASKALKLERRVEAYQWRERTITTSNPTETKRSATIYEKGWYLGHVDSVYFKRPQEHQNIPPSVQSLTLTATPIKVGPYELAPELVEQLQPWRQVPLDGFPVPQGYTRSGQYFTSESLRTPTIGDQRISFRVVNANMPVTIVAQQSSPHLLMPWSANAGDCIGWVLPGLRQASDIMDEKTREATDGLGSGRKFMLVLMAVSLTFALGPHYAKLRQLPHIGVYMRKLGFYMGTGMAAMVSAGLLWAVTTVLAKVTARLIPNRRRSS